MARPSPVLCQGQSRSIPRSRLGVGTAPRAQRPPRRAQPLGPPWAHVVLWCGARSDVIYRLEDDLTMRPSSLAVALVSPFRPGLARDAGASRSLSGRSVRRGNERDRRRAVTIGTRSTRIYAVYRLALVVLMGLVLPMALGPAGTHWVVQWMGGVATHHCACGMKPGTCGCPECARLEAEKLSEAHSASQDPPPALTSDCSHEPPSVGGQTFWSLPPITGFEGIPAVDPSAILLTLEPRSLTPRSAPQPDKPPPRQA